MRTRTHTHTRTHAHARTQACCSDYDVAIVPGGIAEMNLPQHEAGAAKAQRAPLIAYTRTPYVFRKYSTPRRSASRSGYVFRE